VATERLGEDVTDHVALQQLVAFVQQMGEDRSVMAMKGSS